MAKKAYIGAKLLSNLLFNGQFSNETIGFLGAWNPPSYDSAHVKYGPTAMKLTGKTGEFETTVSSVRSIQLTPSHKYYVCIEAYQTTVSGSVDIYWPIAEPVMLSGQVLPKANQWCRISTVADRGAFSAGTYPIRFDYNNQNQAGTMWFDGAMLIDLTAAFGSGKEPTKEWCDAHIQFTAGGQVCCFDTANSVAQQIKNIYIGVDGKARRVMKAYIGVGGKARICYENYQIKPNFSDNNWATIIYACRTKQVPSTWAVGNSKTMLIGGTNYQIDIIGKNHDDYADGSGKAPLTFQMHHCYNTKYRMNSSNTNSGGWNSCEMRTSRMASILAQMPQEAQSAVREVKKLTGAGGGSSSIVTSNDKLFLLSEIEIDGSATYSASGEGSRYAYYQNGGSTIKQVGGSNSVWWTRSPVKYNATAFCNTGATGNVAWGTPTSGANGVSVAFCF